MNRSTVLRLTNWKLAASFAFIHTSLIVGIHLPLPALAAVRIWNGSYSGYWSAARNWSGNVAPRAGDDLVFPAGAARLTNTNNMGAVFRSITFTGSGYVLRATPSSRLRLTGGISAQHTSGTCTVDQPIQLEATQAWEGVHAAAVLDVPGNLDLGAYTLTVRGAGQVRLGGAISGNGGLTMNGDGALRLHGSAANTYVGVTRVQAGLLELAKTPSLFPVPAVPADLDVETTGTIRLLNDYQIWPFYSRAVVTVHGNGLLDLNEHQESVAELVLDGGRVRLGNAGVLTLMSNVTATAGALIEGTPGRVDLGSEDRTFTVADATTSEDFRLQSSVIGAGGIIKTGTGKMVLSQSNAYAGITRILAGTLAVSHEQALAGHQGTTVETGATLELRGTPFGVFNLTEHLSLHGTSDGGVNSLRAFNTLGLGTASFTLEGNCTLGGNAIIRTDKAEVTLFGRLHGTGGFTKTGDGLLRLQSLGESTYQGDTIVQEGTLVLNNRTGWASIPHGHLIIGDGVGGREADIVRLDRALQIGSIPVTVNASGLLDLNGHNEALYRPVELQDGVIDTGSGRLFLGSGAVLRARSSGPIGATLRGHVELGDVPDNVFEMLEGWSPALRVHADLRGNVGLTVSGPGGLDLLASNSFTGPLTVASGNVLVSHGHALGNSNGGTTVAQGASLILDAVDVLDERLTLAGDGDGMGALWSAYGVQAEWTGPITLQTNTTVGVVGPDGLLTLSGAITGPGGLTKIGEGTLVYAGSTTNTYQGNTQVNEGTLQLSKPSFVGAIRHGTLIVGDGIGAVASARVLWTENSQLTERMSWPLFNHALVPVVVNADGLADLNGRIEYFDGLTLHAGRVDTGLEGRLKLDGDVIADSTSTDSAIIKGHLLLGEESFGTIPGTWTFDVSGTNSLLNVRADIAGFWSALRKTGTGRLNLSGSNSYDLETVVDDGVLWISTSMALGTTNQGTRVEPGGTLALGGLGVQVAGEPLVLAGDGFNGQGALQTFPWLGTLSNSWSGAITLSNDTRIGVPTGTILNLTGPISGPGGFTKTGGGPLLLSGNEANTYAGVTRVEQGLLELKMDAPNGAIPGALDIGSAATVRLLQSTQIGNAARVTVAVNGVLDLGGAGEAFDELAGAGQVHLGSGYLNLGLDNGSSTFDGTITGTGNLTKYGTGTVTLRGNNPYTGLTTVREGILVVDGAQSGSAVMVQTAAALRGNGWVGPLTAQGRVQPGDPGANTPGTLTCGNLRLNSSATLAATLFDGGSDRLQVQGNVQLGSAALELFSQTTPWLGQSFWLIENDAADAINGTFAGLLEGGTVTVDDLPLRISYRAGSGNDAVLTFTEAPLEVAGLRVGWGNGNGVLDAGDCTLLEVQLTNHTGQTVVAPQVSLRAGPPGSDDQPVDGLWLLHRESAYPDLPPGTAAGNLAPFQFWLASWWPAPTPADLHLAVRTSSHGDFVLPLSLPTVENAGATPGGGPCELCPADFSMDNALGSRAPTQTGQLRPSSPSTCFSLIRCPGVADLEPRHYHAYPFVNGEASGCITVRLRGPTFGAQNLFSAAYAGTFNPRDLCENYLATAGQPGDAVYSFLVRPFQRFVVVVSTYGSGGLKKPLRYRLEVAGGSCQPRLDIARTQPGQVRVGWTSAAVGYQLESAGTVTSADFKPVSAEPVVLHGICVVTNSAKTSQQFYRLRKP